MILIFGKHIQEQSSKKNERFSHVRSQGDDGEYRKTVV
jgi:hypothetical protein